MFGWFRKKPKTVSEKQRVNYREHALSEKRLNSRAIKTEDLDQITLASIAASTMSDSAPARATEPEPERFSGGGGDYGGGGASSDYGSSSSSSDSSCSSDSGSSGGDSGSGGCD